MNRLRRSRRIGGAIVALALAVWGVLAFPVASAADLEGSHDHALISRFPGSTIIGYWHQDWDQTQFPLSPAIDLDTQTFKTPAVVEGAVTRIVYLSPVGKSPLEVFRNYQIALSHAGFAVKFSCDTNCGSLYVRWALGAVNQSMSWSQAGLPSASNPSTFWPADTAVSADGRALYGTLTQGGRVVHVFVYTSQASNDETRAAATLVEIAEPKAMQSDQITIDANAISARLNEDGKVALYGIFFDTGKALVKPESNAQINEMAKLLRAHPDYKVFIVGHTDNVGSFDANLLLSRQRAEAVRDALVQQYQVQASRLTPYGVANVAPVASNAAESGRSMNRRVELVLR